MSTQEWAVLGTALAIYVIDSAQLLFSNEAMLWQGVRKRWFVWIGKDHSRFGGRFLFLPNPLTPHRPLYRLSWSMAEVETEETPEMVGSHADDLGPLMLGVWVIATALYVILPAALVLGGYEMAVWGLGLAYLSAMLTLAWLYLHRLHLTIETRLVAQLAFECLVCLPCAVNLVRKVAGRRNLNEDAVVACRRVLAPERWDLARQRFLDRLDQAIDAEEEGSHAWRSLVNRRGSLVGEV